MQSARPLGVKRPLERASGVCYNCGDRPPLPTWDPLHPGPAATTEAAPFENVQAWYIRIGPQLRRPLPRRAPPQRHLHCPGGPVLMVVSASSVARYESSTTGTTTGTPLPSGSRPASLLSRPSYLLFPLGCATLPPPVPANACSPPALSFHLSYVTSRALLTPM
jgi:hypothetical protein